MSKERLTTDDPRIQGAVTELEGIITKQYPQAMFDVSEGEDPEGIYLTATVDTDDLTNILELVGDRLVDIQVDEGLPLYLVPIRPLKRVLQEMGRPRRKVRPSVGLDTIAPTIQP